MVNGLQSDPIHPERGLKQGCPLSPILFSIYLIDLTEDLHRSKEGLGIGGIIISALFFADDLVLIGKSRGAIERLLHKLIEWLEKLGMEINTDKTEILEVNPEIDSPITLFSSDGEVLGDILFSLKYKNLGVDIFVKNRMSIFKLKHDAMIHRAKSMARKMKGALMWHGWQRNYGTRLPYQPFCMPVR